MSKLKARSLLMVALLAITFATAVASSTELKCGEQCRCFTQRTGALLREYRVICNQTGLEPLKLTDAIFSEADRSSVFQTYVRIQDSGQVTVTESFIKPWRDFGSCSLDVWRVNHLMLPQVFNASFEEDSWHHVFAGIGIVDSNLDEFPRNIFGGKERGGLRLLRSQVGIMKAGVFSDIRTLKYLEVRDSHVGIIKGSSTTDILRLEKNGEPYPILLKNSVVGKIETGALNVTSKTLVDLVLDDVTIGQLETGGIMVSGVNLVLSNVRVADMQREAVNAQGRGSITIKNSHLIAKPGALTQLPCSFDDHHISANDIVPYTTPKTLKLSNDQSNDNGTSLASPNTTVTEQFSLVDLVSKQLSIVLHQSCIEYNLPQWVLDNDCGISDIIPTPVPMLKSKVLHLGLYSFIVISIVAILVVIILTCILLNTRSRRQPKDSPTVVMSQLPDPIYEEAVGFLMPSPPPPPVPPPVSPHYSEVATCDSNHCSSTLYKNECSAGPSSSKKVENDYSFMH